ncbi:MAG: pitrilysin family protein [Gemmatimonadota bacterium]|nr:pitrilysin family protein [Gemmatimonadota bacterium]
MRSLEPQRHTLKNGIEVVAESMPGAQSVVVAFRFGFGARDDPADRLGLAWVAEETLFKGTPNRDARSIYDAFDSLGARRGSATAVEFTEFHAQLLPRHFSEGLRLYAEVFCGASFPDEQVEVAKTLALEELKRLEDNPTHQVMYLTYQAALGDPMGRNPLGKAPTIAAIEPDDARGFWRRLCSPRRLFISVAGGLETEAMFRAVDEAFGGWERSGPAARDPLPISVADRTVHHTKQSEQAHICLLFCAAPRGHALYYPTQLAVAVLSGSGSSRLFTEVREKRGLAYSVSASYRARRGGGLIALYAGTTADRADETLSVCRREVGRVAEDVTQAELDRAKTVLKGQLFTAGDLPEGRVGSMMDGLFINGRPRSTGQIAAGIDGVTLDRISASLETFPPSPSTIVTLGPQALES